jgi:hypothetical protein
MISTETPEPISIGGVIQTGFDPQNPVPFHKHTGLDSPKIDFNDLLNKPTSSSSDFISGTLTTTNAESNSVQFDTLGDGNTHLAIAYVSAQNDDDTYSGSFIRVVNMKNGVIVDQQQDAFTQKDRERWDVLFEGDELVVQGEIYQTITWTYKLLIVGP